MYACTGYLPLKLHVGRLWVTIVGCVASRRSVEVVLLVQNNELVFPVCWPKWNFIFDAEYSPTHGLFYTPGGSGQGEANFIPQPPRFYSGLSLSVNGQPCANVSRLLHAGRTRCPFVEDETLTESLRIDVSVDQSTVHESLFLEPFLPGPRTSLQCVATPAFGSLTAHAQLLSRVRDAWNRLGFGASVVFARSGRVCDVLSRVPGVTCQIRFALSGEGWTPPGDQGVAEHRNHELTPWSEQGVYAQLCLAYADAAGSDLLALTDVDEMPGPDLLSVFTHLLSNQSQAGVRVFFDADKICPSKDGSRHGGGEAGWDGGGVGMGHRAGGGGGGGRATARSARLLGFGDDAGGHAQARLLGRFDAGRYLPEGDSAPAASASSGGFCPNSTQDWLVRCVMRHDLKYEGVETIMPSSGCFFGKGVPTPSTPCRPVPFVWYEQKRTHFKLVLVPERTWDVSIHHFWPRRDFTEAPLVFTPCLGHVPRPASSVTLDTSASFRRNASSPAIAEPLSPSQAGTKLACKHWCSSFTTVPWSTKCLWLVHCAGCNRCRQAMRTAKQAYRAEAARRRLVNA